MCKDDNNKKFDNKNAFDEITTTLKEIGFTERKVKVNIGFLEREPLEDDKQE